MKEDFENIKSQIRIEDVAGYLLGTAKGMYRYPGERTGSVKVYPMTQSFYDFGRGCGGDSVKLWSHVRGVDSWVALKEIRQL